MHVFFYTIPPVPSTFTEVSGFPTSKDATLFPKEIWSPESDKMLNHILVLCKRILKDPKNCAV